MNENQKDTIAAYNNCAKEFMEKNRQRSIKNFHDEWKTNQ